MVDFFERDDLPMDTIEANLLKMTYILLFVILYDDI